MKKLGTAILTIALICSLAACGGTNNSGDNASKVAKTESKAGNKTKSEKKKYKNIDENTSPVGVSDISAKLSNNDPYIFCKVYKNGGKVEESIIEVTIEVLDEDNNYIVEETLKTSRSLTEGDSETIKEYLGNCGSKERHSNKFLSKCTLNVISIKETDAEEAKEAKALADLMSDIEWKIKYDNEYNSAIAMLEMAKEEYPDSKELNLFEAQMKDELAKKGISMDGSNVEADASEQSEAE